MLYFFVEIGLASVAACPAFALETLQCNRPVHASDAFKACLREMPMIGGSPERGQGRDWYCERSMLERPEVVSPWLGIGFLKAFVCGYAST